MNATNNFKQPEPQEKPIINAPVVQHNQKQSNLLVTSPSPKRLKVETGAPAAKGPSNFLPPPLSIKTTPPSEGGNGKKMKRESMPTFYSARMNILHDEYQSVKGIASIKETQPSSIALKTPPFDGGDVNIAKRKIDESLLTPTCALVSTNKRIVNSNKASSLLSVNHSIKLNKEDTATDLATMSKTTAGKAASPSLAKGVKENDESPRKTKRAKTGALHQTKAKKSKTSADGSMKKTISESFISATYSIRAKSTGDANGHKKRPELSFKERASLPQADTINKATVAPKPLFTAFEIKKLVKDVATVVANEIRNGNCWRCEGPIPHRIIIKSNDSRNSVVKPAKILKNGSKLIDTRQSLAFGMGSSGNQNGSKLSHNKEESHAIVAEENHGEPLKVWIASAVEHFVADVYFPHLIAAKSRMCSKSPTSDRIIISTLIAIREMMIMNADKLFASLPEVNVHAYAGAIVHVCAKKMSSVSSHFSVENFLGASQGYDSRRADFRFSLLETDARAVYILPDGTKQRQEENILTRTSCKFGRSNHPLSFNEKLLTSEDAPKGLWRSHSPAAPCPNACAAILMKTQQQKSETKKVDSTCSTVTETEKYLRFMSRTRSKKRRAYNACIDRK